MKNKWTKENFDKFDLEHPKIYQLFEYFALEVGRKRTHYSAKSVFHRIRWETAIGGDEGDFKIDDGWISHYARKFALNHPEHEDLFAFRVRRNSYHNEGVLHESP